MRKYYIIILVCIVTVTGCTNEKALQICSVLEQELLKSGVENSKILKLGEFSDLSYEINEIKLSETEVQQLVNEAMQMYDKLKEDKKKEIVEKGDFVTIEYESVCEGKVIDANNEKTLKVGGGDFDTDIENSLVGAVKGETYCIQIVIPEGEGELAGKEETTTITVKKIQHIEHEELTDAFVKENFELESVEEFYQFLKSNEESQRQRALEIEAQNQLMNQAVQSCKYSLDENEVLQVALEIYLGYEEGAQTYGASMEEYMSTFMGVTEVIYDACYSEAEEKIKRELMIGAIAFHRNIEGEGNGFNAWLEKKGINLGRDILENTLQEYKKTYIETSVKEYLINITGKGRKDYEETNEKSGKVYVGCNVGSAIELYGICFGT